MNFKTSFGIVSKPVFLKKVVSSYLIDPVLEKNRFCSFDFRLTSKRIGGKGAAPAPNFNTMLDAYAYNRIPEGVDLVEKFPSKEQRFCGVWFGSKSLIFFTGLKQEFYLNLNEFPSLGTIFRKRSRFKFKRGRWKFYKNFIRDRNKQLGLLKKNEGVRANKFRPLFNISRSSFLFIFDCYGRMLPNSRSSLRKSLFLNQFLELVRLKSVEESNRFNSPTFITSFFSLCDLPIWKKIRGGYSIQLNAMKFFLPSSQVFSYKLARTSWTVYQYNFSSMRLFVHYSYILFRFIKIIESFRQDRVVGLRRCLAYSQRLVNFCKKKLIRFSSRLPVTHRNSWGGLILKLSSLFFSISRIISKFVSPLSVLIFRVHKFGSFFYLKFSSTIGYYCDHFNSFFSTVFFDFFRQILSFVENSVGIFSKSFLLSYGQRILIRPRNFYLCSFSCLWFIDRYYKEGVLSVTKLRRQIFAKVFELSIASLHFLNFLINRPLFDTNFKIGGMYIPRNLNQLQLVSVRYGLLNSQYCFGSILQLFSYFLVLKKLGRFSKFRYKPIPTTFRFIVLGHRPLVSQYSNLFGPLLQLSPAGGRFKRRFKYSKKSNKTYGNSRSNNFRTTINKNYSTVL